MLVFNGFDGVEPELEVHNGSDVISPTGLLNTAPSGNNYASVLQHMTGRDGAAASAARRR